MISLKQFISEKKHHQYRKNIDFAPADEYSNSGLSAEERMADRFKKMCEFQTPVILKGEKICFMRTAIAKSNDVFTKAEWEEIRKNHYVHETGYISNLCPDFEGAISKGLLEIRESADEFGKSAIDAIIDLADRYCDEAKKQGREDIAEVLTRVPRYSARNFREALQFFRIIHFGFWLENNYHNTVGRFDKYMYPYFIADVNAGVYNHDTALELLEDFFLSFNKDSDLYIGQQQGDNGQSMMLGGYDENGNEVFNELSKLCLEASANLHMIDPKINLRVNKNTPIEVYELGSKLTKEGLGFPQYSNDDVVIPALVKLGYEPKDAANYTVAACWEFIIPKVGTDINNIDSLSFPKVVDIALHNDLENAQSFDCFMKSVEARIKEETEKICSKHKNVWFVPSPFMNLFVEGGNAAKGSKYNNFGIHGTGVATAADSLTAIKLHIFDKKTLTKQELISAVDSDFETAPSLLPILRYETPKMGQDNDLPDMLATTLLDCFGNSLKGVKNEKGGIYRAGTGTAMFYLWHANEIGASPDGRRKGESLGTNYSPSLFAKINGPFSVIKSFTKQNFENAINGGPLTLEFHHSMFTSPECIKKVASLVKAYIDMGGHQLQLNAVNIDDMRDAQANPDAYRNLIVRIWGWSAYFVELDKEFQDHVISRQEYVI